VIPLPLLGFLRYKHVMSGVPCARHRGKRFQPTLQRLNKNAVVVGVMPSCDLVGPVILDKNSLKMEAV
jgi:hypothetical protein